MPSSRSNPPPERSKVKKEAQEVFKKVNHIAVAVRDLEESLKLFRDVLGLAGGETEVIEEFEVRVAFFTLGETRIELVEPLNPESGLARFLEQRGEGIHHIALEVEDIRAALELYRQRGLRLIHEEPQPGAHGTLVAFIHPKSTGGVLLELCQKAPS
jgi:methylmalonyl-CoA epimerase